MNKTIKGTLVSVVNTVSGTGDAKHGVGVLLSALAAGGLQCSAHDALRPSSSLPTCLYPNTA